MASAKDGARERLARHEAALSGLARRIHATPEVAFAEHRAAAWLGEVLGDAGFAVTPGAGGLPTALVARFGPGPRRVAFCAEYDALPGLGHACGHNLIAAIAAGAGLAASAVAADVGLQVEVIGTPAEESGGGKIQLLERGVFDGLDAALLAHPAAFDVVEGPLVAAAEFDVVFRGRAAHASAAPQSGVNAADALTVAQTALGLLRQHIRSSDRIHGIVTRGGEAPNVVPAHTEARYIVRSRRLADLTELRRRVLRCFGAGALATGCQVEVHDRQKPYAEMRPDARLASLYRRNAEALGRAFPDLRGMLDEAFVSTDMGNVSQVVPAIHPFIGIGSYPAVNHQAEFAAACVGGQADRAIRDGALALAWTAIDVATDAPSA
jgi:amidohydrolase